MGAAYSIDSTDTVDNIVDAYVPSSYLGVSGLGLVISYPTAEEYYDRLIVIRPDSGVGTVSTNIYKSTNQYTNMLGLPTIINSDYNLASPLDFNLPIYPLKANLISRLITQTEGSTGSAPGLPFGTLGTGQGIMYSNFIVTNDETPYIVGYHFSNQMIAESTGSITDQGINADSVKTASFIMPWDPSNSQFTDDSNVTYSYTDLQKQMSYNFSRGNFHNGFWVF